MGLVSSLPSPSYISASAQANKNNLVEDFQITNDDEDLIVPVDPPLRISVFDTSQNLSDSGVAAFLKAASDFATARMQVYFLSRYGNNTYIFESVKFEVLEVQPLVSGRRTQRVFEQEESMLVENYNELNRVEDEEGDVEPGKTIQRIRQVKHLEDHPGSNRSLQSSPAYGTSFVLAGNFTFEAIPAAPKSECNRKLQAQMTKYFNLIQEINAQNHPELNARQIVTEIMTPFPTSAPTTAQPTKSPVKAPSPTPSAIPSVSVLPSMMPTISRAPYYSHAPSTVPSASPTAIPTESRKDDPASQERILPYVIPISAFAVIALSAAFYFKQRRGQDRAMMRKPTLLHHKQLRSGDEDSDDFEFGDSVAEMATGSGLTKDLESGESGESLNMSKESSKESPVDRSIATSETMKAGNVRDINRSMEEKWMSSTTTKSPGEIKFPVPLHSQAALLKGIDDDVANDNVQTGTPKKVPFGTPNAKFKSTPSKSSPSKGINASPVTKVTPSKVSKEEFSKGWDADVPFNWDPEPSISQSAKSSAAKKKGKDRHQQMYSENDIQGSFPSFDMADTLPLVSAQNRSIGNSSLGTSMQSGTETNSSYRSLNEMHPMDWSNKGSEMDGTSVGNSTLTDGDSTGKNPSQDFQWQGRVNTPLYSGAFVTEANTPISIPKPMLSGRSSTFGSKSTGSSPRSRGSSKQLIHDIVWLEKKIADVRSRVDRLDGDDSRTSSPLASPKSPSSLHGSTMSPISANIVCRDIIAPPGKLQIIIHSTKDGPAIHSVKPGSVLEGKVFSGDLIVAINDTDTRSYDAEGVMELMARRSAQERKLTVLHAV
jgi:hypothetical protein